METKPLRGSEYAAVLSLFSAISHHNELFPVLEKRARMVPGLWEKMQTVQRLSDELLDEILPTIPQEKLRHIKADISHVKLYIKVEPPGCVPSQSTEGYSYTPTRTLNELLSYLCENECLLCNRTPVEARKCRARKMLDNALPHDIDAGDGEHCRYSGFVIGMEE